MNGAGTGGAGVEPKPVPLRPRVGGAGQAVITNAGEWVRYSTPGGAEYVAVCLPAFSPATVHRDE